MLAAASPPALSNLASSITEKLPPIRQITRGPSFHWFGYYDKQQFSPDNRYVLGNEVNFEHRSPRPEDAIAVGMVDLKENDRWIELGRTQAWNWQQGCMLQWLPRTKASVMWNVREGDDFAARILDLETKKQRLLSHPIYTISPDGKTGLAPDFRRLNHCRPGYGYAGIPDPNRDICIPDNAGVWRIDMSSGASRLLFTFADAARIPFAGPPAFAFKPGAMHWFNHLLFNTDGSRFFFLHRWRNPGERIGAFHTRAFTCNPEGKDWFCIDPNGGTSHFIWRDPHHILAWAWHPSHGDKFYLFEDKTEHVEVVAPDVMTVNGHNTYLPQTAQQWVLNDTYPDKQRYQHPYLYHLPSHRKIALGHFLSPPDYTGEWRCDTHPRASSDGRWVCIDSPHNQGRQMYLLDLHHLT
jgi:hypothetical protein